MKVLQVTPYMETKYGGPVFVATMIGRFLRANKIKSKILTSAPIEQFLDIDIVAYRRTSNTWFFSLDFLKNSYKEIRECDSILIHGVYTFFTLWTCVLALVYRKKVFLRPAGMLDIDSIFDGKKFKVLARLCYLSIIGPLIYLVSCKIIFNSSKEKDNSIFCSSKKSVILPNGVDPRVVNIKCKQKLFGRKYKLFFMGRLDPIKGIDLLVRVINGLDSDIREKLELIVAGDGEREFVQELRAQSCDSIKYVGHIEGDLKYQYLKECDIYLQPSKTEGLSNSMIEAMFCKVAIVTTRNVGLASELLERSAAKVVSFDENEMGKAIVELINSQNLIKKYQDNSFRFARDSYNFEKNIHNYINIFKQAC